MTARWHCAGKRLNDPGLSDQKTKLRVFFGDEQVFNMKDLIARRHPHQVLCNAALT